MKKYPLIEASIITVVLLVIGSLTSVVGVRSSASSAKESSNRNILTPEQLKYYGLWTPPDKNQHNSISSFHLWTPKPQIYRTLHTALPYSIKLNNSNYKEKSPIITSRGKTLYVGGKGPGNYSTIWLAIYAASNGDTVFVYSGTYHARILGIAINKSINLIGENRNTTILDGRNNPNNFFRIMNANGVTISGFTFKNNGVPLNPYIGFTGAITIFSSHNTISGNIFSNNTCGILPWNFYGPADYNIISDNIFTNNSLSMLIEGAKHTIVSYNVFSNDGVWLSDSYQNTFLNNSVNSKPLIYLEDESNKIINEDAGQVILINCNNITVQNKDLSNATVGIILDGTHNCLISGNSIRSDKCGGIYCLDSNSNNFSMNIISNTSINGGGILIDNSTDNVVFSNSITLNEGIGVALYDFSESNTILMNNFSDNQRGLVLTGGADYNTVTDNCFFNDGAYIYGAWKNTFLNNSVNNKPLLYLEDQSDKVIDDDAGQVILVSCDSITVHNQKISNVCTGIMVVASNNCLITDNIVDSNKEYGIYLTHSTGINISSNNISNTLYGLFIEESRDNTLLWNTITSNKYIGMWFYNSSYNNILSNTIKENGGLMHDINGGIYLFLSSFNKILQNNFQQNVKGDYFQKSASNKWDGNYWDKPRIFPKPIWGTKNFFIIHWYTFDWHHAQEPYDIPG
jgi:parallel beta-helix repeat protein